LGSIVGRKEEAYFNRAVSTTKIGKTREDLANIIADYGMVLQISKNPDLLEQAQKVLETFLKNSDDPVLRQQAADALQDKFTASDAAETGAADAGISPATLPEGVVQAIFDAAQSGNFASLKNLCDPLGENDGDTQMICDVAADDTNREQFVQYFAAGKINGEVIISPTGDQAAVPFLFGPDGNSEETMELINRDGQWYLFSF